MHEINKYQKMKVYYSGWTDTKDITIPSGNNLVRLFLSWTF